MSTHPAPFVEWSDDLALDHGLVDSQHQRLIGLIGDLEAAVSLGRAREVLAPIFDELVDYTMVHFEAEEGIMSRAEYPTLETHQREHNSFGQRAIAFQTAHHAGEKDLGGDLAEFLRDWLVNHIKRNDRLFWDFVASDTRASELKRTGAIYG